MLLTFSEAFQAESMPCEQVNSVGTWSSRAVNISSYYEFIIQASTVHSTTMFTIFTDKAFHHHTSRTVNVQECTRMILDSTVTECYCNSTHSLLVHWLYHTYTHSHCNRYTTTNIYTTDFCPESREVDLFGGHKNFFASRQSVMHQTSQRPTMSEGWRDFIHSVEYIVQPWTHMYMLMPLHNCRPETSILSSCR